MRTDLHLTATQAGSTAVDGEVFHLPADGALTRLTAPIELAGGYARAPAVGARAEGGPSEPLSVRELECMRWVAAGKTDWEIGTILSISATTVKFHVNRARDKLGARNRAQATARLVLFGLL